MTTWVGASLPHQLYISLERPLIHLNNAPLVYVSLGLHIIQLITGTDLEAAYVRRPSVLMSGGSNRIHGAYTQRTATLGRLALLYTRFGVSPSSALHEVWGIT